MHNGILVGIVFIHLKRETGIEWYGYESDGPKGQRPGGGGGGVGRRRKKRVEEGCGRD